MENQPTTITLMGLLHSSHMNKEKNKPMFRLKVKEVAEQKDISQRQLFFRSGVDIKTIQRIYRYPTTTVVTVETLARLAQVLGVDVSELIESVPNEPGSDKLDET